MRNKIIINERIAKEVQNLMRGNYALYSLINTIPIETTVIKNNTFNRPIINTVFSILEDGSKPGCYEYYIDRIFSIISKNYPIIKDISNEKLNIDLNELVNITDNNSSNIDKICNIIYNKIIKSAAFYTVINVELNRFYNNRTHSQQPYVDIRNPQPIQLMDIGNYCNYYDRIPTNQPQQPVYEDNYNFEYYNKLNQEETQRTIDDIFNQIPMFGNDGKPMNKAATNVIKAIDRRIANHEKVKARKAK